MPQIKCCNYWPATASAALLDCRPLDLAPYMAPARFDTQLYLLPPRFQTPNAFDNLKVSNVVSGGATTNQLSILPRTRISICPMPAGSFH